MVLTVINGKYNTLASQKALGFQNLTKNGGDIAKYVADIGNPEKIQNYVKIKRHDQTEVEIKKVKTYKVAQPWYASCYEEFFPLNAANFECLLILT